MKSLRIFYALNGLLAALVLLGDGVLGNGFGAIAIDVGWIIVAICAFVHEGRYCEPVEFP